MTERPLNSDRRIKRSYQEWAQILALLINFGGLVWFAASLNSSVLHLDQTSTRTNLVVDKALDKIATDEINIAILQSEVQGLKETYNRVK